MVVESYVFIGRTIGVNCEQMMEFASKIKKGKPCEMDLPLLQNDITNNLGPQKPVIYSRYMKSGLSAYTLEVSHVSYQTASPQYIV